MTSRVLPRNLLPLSTKDIIGVTDGSNAASTRLGYYTEVKTDAAHNFAATGQYRDMDTTGGSGAITVGPGDWTFGMSVVAVLAGATMSNWFCGIGTTTGNSAAGLSYHDGTLGAGVTPTGLYDVTCTLLVRKSVEVSTTFYAKVMANYTAGNPTYSGIMWARRTR